MSPTELSPALRDHLAVTYDLLRPLGEGGMGVVWLGRDRLLDREVAIKVLRRDASGDQDTARRFLQEARLAARLQHPGIVPLLTFGEVGDERFYVMPFVRGETLSDRMRRGPLSEPELRRIVAEVADALAYVHARGIVHRDVKPANILLDAESGSAMLTDFGIARMRDVTSVTGTGLVVGTPRYLAPEQASAGVDPVDGRADVYALGLVAWEAATAAPAFGNVSPNELLARKLTGALEDPRRIRPDISPSLASAILRASAAAVEDRFPSAAAFASELRPAPVGPEDPLRPFDSVLSLFALASIPASATAVAMSWSEASPQGLGARTLEGIGVAVGVISLMAVARMHGLRREFAPTTPWRDLIRRAWRPPAWWFSWWPKRWRHFFLPEHLPPQASRALRRQVITFAWMFGTALAYQLPLLLLGFADETALMHINLVEFKARLGTVAFAAPFIVLAAGVWGMAPFVSLQRRWKRAGLDVQKIGRLFGRIYDPAALSSPVLAALHEFERSSTAPQNLPALAEAVRKAQARAQDAGWIVDDVHSAVQRLQDLDQSWAEHERVLRREVDASDASRAREQAERLRQMGNLSPGQRQMLALLESQERLVADSIEALERVRSRRAAALGLLTRLYEQLRLLPEGRVGQTDDSPVRAITVELQRLLDEPDSR